MLATSFTRLVGCAVLGAISAPTLVAAFSPRSASP
jgi:hypothetical protein